VGQVWQGERERERESFNQNFKTEIGIKIKRFLEKPFNTQLKVEKYKLDFAKVTLIDF
jgi:hypothetical protein